MTHLENTDNIWKLDIIVEIKDKFKGDYFITLLPGKAVQFFNRKFLNKLKG